MAVEARLYDVTMLADGDLSDAQHYFMMLHASDEDYIDLADAAAATLFGVLQDKPEASGRACNVRRIGRSKLVLGGTVTYGQKLTSDANGAGVAATAGQRYGAIALEGGDAGDTVTVEMEFGYVP